MLDIGLPGMHGWDVLAEIRRQPGGDQIPVLILTAHANEEDRFRTGSDGADAFMTKPFNPEDLAQVAARDTVIGRLADSEPDDAADTAATPFRGFRGAPAAGPSRRGSRRRPGRA